MAGVDRYSEAVSKATYGRETRVPIVSSIEYWLGSADRLRNTIRKQIEIFKNDTLGAADSFNDQNKNKPDAFYEANKDKPQAFYDRNHPSVDNRIDELTAQYAPHVKKIELTDPVPFPIGSHTETIHYPPTIYAAVSSGTEQLTVSQISGEDYLLTSERIDDVVGVLSGEDYLLSLGSGWTEEALDDPHEDITVIDYDYDYTLAFTRANGA